MTDRNEHEARIREAMRQEGYRVTAFDWTPDSVGVVLNPLDCRGPGTYVTAQLPQRECGHPADDGSGCVCRRVCGPGRDYHGA